MDREILVLAIVGIVGIVGIIGIAVYFLSCRQQACSYVSVSEVEEAKKAIRRAA